MYYSLTAVTRYSLLAVWEEKDRRERGWEGGRWAWPTKAFNASIFARYYSRDKVAYFNLSMSVRSRCALTSLLARGDMILILWVIAGRKYYIQQYLFVKHWPIHVIIIVRYASIDEMVLRVGSIAMPRRFPMSLKLCVTTEQIIALIVCDRQRERERDAEERTRVELETL